MSNNKTLFEGSKLRREDGEIFTCTYLSHWSDVKSDDGKPTPLNGLAMING